jgi:hypothetical protein
MNTTAILQNRQPFFGSEVSILSSPSPHIGSNDFRWIKNKLQPSHFSQFSNASASARMRITGVDA